MTDGDPTTAPAPTSLCYTGRRIHRACLDALFENSRVTSVVVAGPPLTPLPFLADPEEFATRRGVPVLESEDLSRDRLTALAGEAEVAVSLGCRRILTRRELSAPRYGTFNLHPSALPMYRGPHPDLYAIMDGKSSIGITLHRMARGIDSGPIFAQATEDVRPDDTIVSLTDRLYSRGAALVADLLGKLTLGSPIPESQQPKVFDQLQLRREIDWRDSAWRIDNLVRALAYPWPMAKTYLRGKELLLSKARVVPDGRIAPGAILALLSDGIRVGTGGHSIDVLEIRDQGREVITPDRFVSEFEPVPGQTCLGSDGR